jgi:ribulose 1,5-bisphosphate synthetase/thiazole synthase
MMSNSLRLRGCIYTHFSTSVFFGGLLMTERLAAANADEVHSCELCIIGAGIAGLNALFVASQYLGKTDKVVLIDRNSGPGGMWNDVYDYCRLHAPHPSFTVGDIAWAWSKPKEYLATGAQVSAHLVHCLEVMRGKVILEERFAHTVTRCDEVVTKRGAVARIEYQANDGSGGPRVIEAKKVIKAFGFDVPLPDPLALTSQNVISTTPLQLSQNGGFTGTSPVFVVGGGKTGMDTAHTLIEQACGRPITLINGKGTVFVNRAILFPRGARRWWDGRLLVSAFRDMALRYDGTNEDETFDYFRREYAIHLDGSAEQFLFGILSKEERDAIAAGLRGIVNDYLDDVVDGADGPEMVLRSGRRVPVEPGSVFVNCTGHLVRHGHRYEPYLSQQGTILAITPRSIIHYLSSVSAYFLTHMFFLDKLADAPLYEFDAEGAFSKDRRMCHTAVMSVSFMNLITLLQTLPFRVFDRCGLDIDRLFPLPRRLAALIDLKLNGDRYVAHCREALDRVREIHSVRCGPLTATANLPVSAEPELSPYGIGGDLQGAS